MNADDAPLSGLRIAGEVDLDGGELLAGALRREAHDRVAIALAARWDPGDARGAIGARHRVLGPRQALAAVAERGRGVARGGARARLQAMGDEQVVEAQRGTARR